ncbi:internalin [Hexamita inflata]|uniref:Internalin n=1 Tax=Hexamita inflata TaxID=28002 RepID=A0AA86UZP8_9EUKA|nr:internalin [Hexamita inflata]
MTEQNQNILNQEHDEQMTIAYEGKIYDGDSLYIGNLASGDPEVTNLRFLEKLHIQTVWIYVNEKMNLKLRHSTIKNLTMDKYVHFEGDTVLLLNLIVDELELENLEVLTLQNNNLGNDQLFNLAKFKKLHTLNVSKNSVDLTHIHNVTSLTTLYMVECGIKNIELIASLINLEDLDLSINKDLNINPLCKIISLTKLCLSDCNLKQIDQMGSLTNLNFLNLSNNLLQNVDSIRKLVNIKELNISQNKNLDISPLKELFGLVKLDLTDCDLRQLIALKPLINLQILDISNNPNVNITELQYLKNLLTLQMNQCNLVSICVLRTLVNLEYLEICQNKIVYLDANITDMKQLIQLLMAHNRISDFTSVYNHQNYGVKDDNYTYDYDEYIPVKDYYFHTYDQTEPEEEKLLVTPTD